MHTHFTRVTLAITAVAIVAIAGGVTYAVADIGGDGVIHGCYTKGGGVLRVVDPSGRQECSGNQTPISWNQQGPKGATGPQGPTGPQGVPGTSTYTVFIGTMVPGTSVARAFCPAGTHVTGGGGHANSWGVALNQSHPISDETGVVGYGTSSIGWQVAAVDGSDVQAYVFCAS
jgi:hypothetical protein